MSINKVILVGNVGNDPELKKSDKATGTSVTTFNVATHETRKDKNGDKVKKTEWHRIVTFGKLAELCNEYLKKGRQVYVEGQIRSRTYKDKEDKEQRIYEIIASDVKFMGNANGASKPTAEAPNDENDSLVDI